MGFLDRIKHRRSTREPRPTAKLVIAGFGVELAPKLPVGVAQLEDGTLIVGPIDLAAARSGVQVNNVLVKPGTAPIGELKIQASEIVTYSTGQAGTTLLALGAGMDTYEDVLDTFKLANHQAGWRILASSHEIHWPPRFTLRARGDQSPHESLYQLSSSGDRMMFVRGPFTSAQTPRPEQLIGPGQELLEQGGLEPKDNTIIWLDLAYDHSGVPWRQRHYYIAVDGYDGVHLLTCQSPRNVADDLFSVSDLVASSLRPRQ